MSADVQWYVILIAIYALLFAGACLAGWRGLVRYGAYVEREEKTAVQIADAAILIRACTGFLQDLDFERRRRDVSRVTQDHPVVPPDSEPSDIERSVA